MGDVTPVYLQKPLSDSAVVNTSLIAAFQYLKGPTGRMERGFSQGCAVTGQGGMAVN